MDSAEDLFDDAQCRARFSLVNELPYFGNVPGRTWMEAEVFANHHLSLSFDAVLRSLPQGLEERLTINRLYSATLVLIIPAVQGSSNLRDLG
jgi:hypothetical protein